MKIILASGSPRRKMLMEKTGLKFEIDPADFDERKIKEKPKLFGNPEKDANFLLTLCHMESYLLDRQIKAAETRFIKEGGYSERLAKKRREFRGY